MIKLRAWIGKRFVYGPRGNEVNASWVLAMCKANSIEPDQSAGLFDKNGVEAWAGDIVKIPNAGNHEVIFKEGCFGFKGKISDIVYLSQFEWRNCEIIGNKHQNPELLEGE